MSLDLETMSNAADIINSELTSRAYIDENLQFPTIHWKELLGDQIDNLKVTHHLYNNDKNLINIIHSLIGAVDRSRKQHHQANIVIKKKDNEINKLTTNIDTLQDTITGMENKLSENIQVNQSQLQRRVQELERENNKKAREIRQLRIAAANIKTKYNVDVKKRDLQISDLKNKLLDKRSLNSSSLNTYVNQPPDLNSNIIFNNNPIIDNPVMTSSAGEEVESSQDVLREEYENIIADLTPIIESLITENFKYSSFVQTISDYLNTVNGQLVNKKEISNPSESIDLAYFNTIEPAQVKEYFKSLESFEKITKPLLNNVYKFYHTLNELLDNSNGVEKSRLKQLENELETVKKNWKDAMKIADDWKKRTYEQTRE